MKAHRQDDQIIERAAEWVAALKRLSAQEQAALADWLMESPRHLEEFFLMAAVDRELEGIDVEDEICTSGASVDDHSNVVPFESSNSPVQPSAPASPRHRSMGRGKKFALAAGLGGLAVTTAWSVATHTQWSNYSTAMGEIRSFELADGSVIDLNTQSRVKVHFTSKERTIQLVAGEAMFKVDRDVTRPFRVHVGEAVIQALGTQFNVHRRERQTNVAVIEGAVGISTNEMVSTLSAQSAPSKAGALPYTQLQTGQGISIRSDGKILPTGDINPAKVTAWRQRRLLFKDDTLTDIAEEFNRYNRKPQVRLADETIGSKRLSGVFDADAPESLLSFLARNEELSLERTRNEVVIRANPRKSLSN